MRRKDREITDFDEMLSVIRKCDVCRIAMIDGEVPYIVPLNFGLDVQDNQVYFYFHSALEGRKMDLLRENPKVAFEMDCSHEIILYEEQMDCTMGYESVMGRGVIEFVPEEEKFDALKILMRQYHEEDFAFSTKLMKVTAVYRRKVTQMTGKRRDNRHPGEKGRPAKFQA